MWVHTAKVSGYVVHQIVYIDVIVSQSVNEVAFAIDIEFQVTLTANR